MGGTEVNNSRQLISHSKPIDTDEPRKSNSIHSDPLQHVYGEAASPEHRTPSIYSENKGHDSLMNRLRSRTTNILYRARKRFHEKDSLLRLIPGLKLFKNASTEVSTPTERVFCVIPPALLDEFGFFTTTRNVVLKIKERKESISTSRKSNSIFYDELRLPSKPSIEMIDLSRKRQRTLSTILENRGSLANLEKPFESTQVVSSLPTLSSHQAHFCSNRIRTSKYTFWTFIPKNLFEQFRRLANFYFLLMVLLQVFPQIQSTNAGLAAVPITIIVSITAIKDGLEDWRRYRSDIEVNRRATKVLSREGFVEVPCEEVQVGDYVLLENNQSVPADLMILATSEPNNACYVETKNLDGETNLKVVQGPLKNSHASPTPEALSALWIKLNIESPNVNLYKFAGNVTLMRDPSNVYPIGINNILLRGSVVRHTKCVVGVVLYTGVETKLMLNSGRTPSKRTRIERKMNPQVFASFLLMLVISLACAGAVNSWRSRFPATAPFMLYVYDGQSSALIFFLTLAAAILIFQSTIPISLYVTLELVKIFHAFFIHEDLEMYHEETDARCIPKSWGLSDDLGQIAYVFSDKTGTLTRNDMVFKRCSIAGHVYGPPSGKHTVDDSHRHHRRQGANALSFYSSSLLPNIFIEAFGERNKYADELFSFSDPSLIEDLWSDNTQLAETIRLFFFALAVCHTVLIERGEIAGESDNEQENIKSNQTSEGSIKQDSKDEVTGVLETTVPLANSSPISENQSEPIEDSLSSTEHVVLHYQAQSPDEAALVNAAKNIGFVFVGRELDMIHLNLLGKKETCRLLHVIEFTSDRKRMSVMVRMPDGHILLLTKGADSVIYERLEEATGDTAYKTLSDLEEFAVDGLRTLVVAYRIISEEEYVNWAPRYQHALARVDVQREKDLEALSEEMECRLCLLGATAIEDKLQHGVPECISALSKGGLRIWVLTGDKQETAINIGFSCELLNPDDFDLFIIRGLNAEKIREELLHASKLMNEQKRAMKARSLLNQHGDTTATSMIAATTTCRRFALIIDGASLKFALETKRMSGLFLDVALECSAVICCRVSPLQKAQVVRLVKRYSYERSSSKSSAVMTLAIGDGANDVSMIQEADVGIGISGVEGMQAVMASDYAIAQFRYLSRLLLVHGHWCYYRIAEMILLFFYKNLIMIVALFCFQMFCGFTAQLLFEFTYIMFYNLIFTSLPVTILAVLDQDVTDRSCQRYPQLYQVGIQQKRFTRTLFWLYMLEALWQGVACFFVPYAAHAGGVVTSPQGLTDDLWSFGTIVMSAVIVNCTLTVGLQMRRWNVYAHLASWGSILVWFAYVLVYSLIPIQPAFGLAWFLYRQATFWFLILLTVIIAIGPRYLAKAIRTQWYPSDIDVIAEAEKHHLTRYINPSGGPICMMDLRDHRVLLDYYHPSSIGSDKVDDDSIFRFKKQATLFEWASMKEQPEIEETKENYTKVASTDQISTPTSSLSSISTAISTAPAVVPSEKRKRQQQQQRQRRQRRARPLTQAVDTIEIHPTATSIHYTTTPSHWRRASLLQLYDNTAEMNRGFAFSHQDGMSSIVTGSYNQAPKLHFYQDLLRHSGTMPSSTIPTPTMTTTSNTEKPSLSSSPPHRHLVASLHDTIVPSSSRILPEEESLTDS